MAPKLSTKLAALQKQTEKLAKARELGENLEEFDAAGASTQRLRNRARESFQG